MTRIGSAGIERATDALAAELPTWTRSESAYLVATHLRSVGVAPDEAEAVLAGERVVGVGQLGRRQRVVRAVAL